MPERTSADLDLLFGALADATRRGIVERLAAGEATVTSPAPERSAARPASTAAPVRPGEPATTSTRHAIAAASLSWPGTGSWGGGWSSVAGVAIRNGMPCAPDGER